MEDVEKGFPHPVQHGPGPPSGGGFHFPSAELSCDDSHPGDLEQFFTKKPVFRPCVTGLDCRKIWGGRKTPGKKKKAHLDKEGRKREGTCPLALRLGERVFCFLPWGTYRVGSEKDAELPLKNFSVEGVHCEILSSPKGLKIVDRCGRTFLEGAPVEEVDLSPGMRLHLGKVPLEVLLREEAERAYLVRPGGALSRKRPKGGEGDLGGALRRYQKALGPTFFEEIQRGLKAGPWFTISLGAHLVLLFLLWNLPVFRGSLLPFPAMTRWEPRLEDQLPPPGSKKEGPDKLDFVE
ncbi:MAG TPA: FHA domain-containing protein, partial [Planctomycetes bacterium]|nr:FHA domain-containing protein [Planctomycetota bacterium]